PARMHSPAANRFDDFKNPFAVGEHIEDRRQLSHVLRKGAVPDKMTGDAEQLRHHDANHFYAVRNFDSSQFLDRQAVGEVVHHAAKVIDAVGIGDVSVPGLAFRHLLRAAVEIADHGHHVYDLFAIYAQ